MKHFYPGMGATSSMYGHHWRRQFRGQFHDWPQSQGEQTLNEIAQRLIQEHQIRPGDTIIGTSLGGIVACEIANLIRLDRIVLIGSATRKEEISSILTILHPLIDLSPLSFVQLSSGKLPNELSKMFSNSDPDFIRNMSKAIFSWNGLRNEVPTTRLHGVKDLVIPLPDPIDHKIDGGHLIAMTHEVECVNAIKQSLPSA